MKRAGNLFQEVANFPSLMDAVRGAARGKKQKNRVARFLKYFDSIDHKVLKTLLRDKVKDQEMLWLLDTFIDHPMPSTSPHQKPHKSAFC